MMKILDAPSQFKNVRNTTSQCHRHQLRQEIYNVLQTNHQTSSMLTKTPGTPNKTPCTPNNTPSTANKTPGTPTKTPGTPNENQVR